MTRQERAKQFAPFDALKGLQEALRQKEIEHEKIDRMGLTDEQLDLLNKTWKNIKKGSRVQLTYFCDGYYTLITGKITEKDDIMQYIRVDDLYINFDDFFSINILE